MRKILRKFETADTEERWVFFFLEMMLCMFASQREYANKLKYVGFIRNIIYLLVYFGQIVFQIWNPFGWFKAKHLAT